MPNLDYRQFMDRFQSIERRLRAVELKPNPQVVIAAGKTLTVNHSMTLAGADGRTLTIPATGTAALLGTAQTFSQLNIFSAGIGINTSSPVGLFDANLDGNGATYRRYGGSPSFQFARANGTIASPTQVNSATTIGAMGASALDDTGVYRTVAIIRFNGDAAVTSTSAPGSIAMQTTPSGSTTPSTRLAILNDGNVGINEASPTAQLQVEQTSATGAKPTLRLQQLDLSEEFIRFDSTVSAGNPINTTALGAYYGRVRVYVEGVGAKWLALYD